MATTKRDRDLAHIAKQHGANYSLRIILEARRAGIPISLGFAIVQQESDFTNVFGGDPTIYAGAGKVTKAKYLRYKLGRGPAGRGGMQGVGPCQLTWWEYQDAADRLGGCWVAANNIRVGFTTLATLIRDHGEHDGIAAFNGAGPAAQRYARQVKAKQDHWHEVLT